MFKSICVASQKGGVGKTTTAVNLAASLALIEKRTLLIDCDPQGHATKWSGISPENEAPGLEEVLSGRVPAGDAVMKTSLEFLDIVPNRSGFFQWDFQAASSGEGEKAPGALLDEVGRPYEFVIIDTPPSLGRTTAEWMTVSDWLLIPMQCRFYSFEGLEQILSMVRHIRNERGAGVRIAGILFSMGESGERFCSYFPPAALKSFESVIFSTTIPFDPLFPEAAERGKPLCLHHIGSRGAEAYIDLACEIVGLI